MRNMIPYFVIAIIAGAAGVIDAINMFRNPGKSPAQRRAQRENCRSKGL